MFRSIFRPYGLVWTVLNTITDVVGLTLCWLLCCLPIVTVFPATAALYDAVVHGIRYREEGPYKRFFRTFRAEWKSGILSTLLWGAVLGFFGYLLAVLLTMARQDSGFSLYAGIYLAGMLLPIGAACWSAAIISPVHFFFPGSDGTAVRFLLPIFPFPGDCRLHGGPGGLHLELSHLDLLPPRPVRCCCGPCLLRACLRKIRRCHHPCDPGRGLSRIHNVHAENLAWTFFTKKTVCKPANNHLPFSIPSCIIFLLTLTQKAHLLLPGCFPATRNSSAITQRYGLYERSICAVIQNLNQVNFQDSAQSFPSVPRPIRHPQKCRPDQASPA